MKIMKRKNKKVSSSLYKKVRRVHRLTNHKQEGSLLHIYKESGKDLPLIRQTIKQVISNCDTCQRTKKSLGTPKFSFPKATNFNEILSIDLKEIEGKYILWIICSFTRFARGVVLKSKVAKEVVNGLYHGWWLLYGCPSRGLWSDNGKEFRNKTLRDFCSRWTVQIKFGAP